MWLEPLQYPFMVRALAASALVGITGGVVGSFLLVRRWSLLGDAISHAVLPGVALAYVLGWPYFAGALISSLATAAGIGFVERHTRLKSDAATGILFLGAFALGLAVLGRVRSSVDVFHVLFGNVLAVSRWDLAVLAAMGMLVLAVVLALFKELQLWAFDPVGAQVAGLPVGFLHYLMLVLVSATIVGALQAVGIVLALAMLVTPPATAFLLTRRMPQMMGVAALVGALSATGGLYLSYYLNLASGPAMVLVATFAFACALLLSPQQGLLARRRRARPRQQPGRQGDPASRRVRPGLFAALAAAGLGLPWALASLGTGQRAALADPEPRPVVVTSINILADLAARVGGDRVAVYSLLGPGQDPHTYEPTPHDARMVQRARRLLVNGYGLDFWAVRLASSRPNVAAVAVAEAAGIPTLPWPGRPDYPDPHLWMDPLLAARYVEQIATIFEEMDPAGQAEYRRRAALLVEELHQLHRWIEAQLASVPPERRKLVTTHDAYRYFGRRYGLEVLDSVWGVSTDEEPSAYRLGVLLRRLRQHGVPAFVESTVNPRILQELAAQAGVPIGGKLYADALGPPGSGADSYAGMMRHNVRTLVQALAPAPAPAAAPAAAGAP
ncbi:MAG TPA: metal ABC transporter permease [Limnochordales bacterium]